MRAAVDDCCPKGKFCCGTECLADDKGAVTICPAVCHLLLLCKVFPSPLPLCHPPLQMYRILLGAESRERLTFLCTPSTTSDTHFRMGEHEAHRQLCVTNSSLFLEITFSAMLCYFRICAGLATRLQPCTSKKCIHHSELN
jgi:hypothetical protein